MEPTFSPRQLAKRHGVKYNTIRFAVVRGDLKSTRTKKGHYRITDTAYLEWVADPAMHDHNHREKRGLPPDQRKTAC